MTKERLEMIEEDVNEARHLSFSDWCIELITEVKRLQKKIDELEEELADAKNEAYMDYDL